MSVGTVSTIILPDEPDPQDLNELAARFVRDRIKAISEISMLSIAEFLKDNSTHYDTAVRTFDIDAMELIEDRVAKLISEWVDTALEVV